MAGARVRLIPAGMRDLLNLRGVRKDLTRRMGPVLDEARRNAPVDTGEYKASLSLVQATTDRAVVRVVANDSKALGVEAVTGNLARALDQAGGS